MLRFLRTASVAFLVTAAAGGCAAIVPFVEPDQQAVSSLPATVKTPLTAVPGASSKPAAARQSTRLTRLCGQLHHPDSVVRTHAAFWLGEMGSSAAPAVPGLVSNLGDSSNWVRRASAKALGKIGSPAAVPPLINTLHDRDRFVAHSAANALRRINTAQARAALATYKGV